METKAYGSYAGGKFDTVDISTGNLTLDIPLISYPQRGQLPPLAFSIELNNAPYSRVVFCAPDENEDNGDICGYVHVRYDTSAPGSLLTAYGFAVASEGTGANVAPGKVGAYITSTYEGPVVTGSPLVTHTTGEGSAAMTPSYAQMLYTLVDPAGKTHALESGTDNLNVYHAQDGTGWTFLPTGPGNAYDYFDPENFGIGMPSWPSTSYWLTGEAQAEIAYTGVRSGAVLSPTGLTYTYQFVPQPQLASSLLSSTASDPLGNTITRRLWYWSSTQSTANDVQSFYASSNQPLYVDSIGRRIPDIVSLQETAQASGNSNSGGCPSGTTSLAWNPPGLGGNTLSYTFCYTSMTMTLALGSSRETGQETGGMNVLTSVVLPNGKQWTFTYDPSTTNLIRVGLPTGGSISYTYQVANEGRCSQDDCEAVRTRAEDDGMGNISTDTYAFSYSSNPGSSPSYTTLETDSLGNDTAHTFHLIGSTPGGFTSTQLFETNTAYYQGSSTASSPVLLRSVATDYEYQWDTTGPNSGLRAIGVYPIKVVTTNAQGSTTTVARKYSADLGSPLFTARRIVCASSSTVENGDDPSSCQDYLPSTGYPANSSGTSTNTPSIGYVEASSEAFSGFNTLLRTTTTQFQFQADGRYKAANIISLPHSVTVQGGESYWRVRAASTTTFNYDEQNGSPQGVYGELTSKNVTYSMWDVNTFSATTGTVFNSNGMPSSMIDPNHNVTLMTYDATGLFASAIQKPTTNGIQHTDYYSYDSSLGLLNSHTDENGSSAGDTNYTTTYSRDSMGRVTGIHTPDGGSTTFCYTDTGGASCASSGPPFKLEVVSTATPDPSVSIEKTYDGLGRIVKSTVLSDPLGATSVDTTYDLEGRVQSVSNPHRASSNDPTNGTTSYVYDALGRTVLKIQPDGSRQQTCYNGIATNGQTNCSRLSARTFSIGATDWVDVSDEAGRHSQQLENALGQLAGVVEPNPQSGALALETDYYYDVLGDLLVVNQLGSGASAARNRVFAYYAPSMVEVACNPEALAPNQSCNPGNNFGIQYSYDPNGNVIQKTDNRNISITYTYDALNRLTSKTYSDHATPTSCYQYDSLGASNNGVGRLASAWTQSASYSACSISNPAWSKTSVLAYDAMGRVLSEQQCTPSTCSTSTPYTSSYTYNLAGQVSTFSNVAATIPGIGSLHFANTRDAAGRLQTLTSNWNDGTHPGTLFSAQAGPFTSCTNSSVAYSPAGGLENATFGTGLVLNRGYDNRLRTTCEVDSGYGANQPAAGGFGTVEITGQEQGK